MPARSTEATIMVCVNDVNDESPVLSMTQYNTSIPENHTMERVLFTVSTPTVSAFPPLSALFLPT